MINVFDKMKSDNLKYVISGKCDRVSSKIKKLKIQIKIVGIKCYSSSSRRKCGVSSKNSALVGF